jgi:thiosulfate/3-mercaptopyruvate sulfurtransferase
MGLVPERPVVVYDDGDGLFAARLWWMLRWMGHAHVRVLDGGLSHWKRLRLPLSTSQSEPHPNEAHQSEATPPLAGPAQAPYPEREALEQTVSLAELSAQLHRSGLIDARAPERFQGRAEPLDRVAGHIPGARNHFFRENLAEDGRFKDAQTLRKQWLAFLGKPRAEATAWVHQCGSGVSACHNLLALRVAGLPAGRLYVGSWSQWCAEPSRPVARGPG